MKRLFLILTILASSQFFLNYTTFSTKPVPSLPQEYFIGVFAENIAVASPVGHAFIGIGKGTPLVCSTDGSETEAWGFYPKVRVEGAKSYWFGPMDAVVRNDIYTKMDHQFFKKITFDEYIKIKLKIEEWKKKKYELTRNDCISFTMDVCKTLDGTIIVPVRETTDTPDKYVLKLINVNK
jgi:hypothetical protein